MSHRNTLHRLVIRLGEQKGSVLIAFISCLVSNLAYALIPVFSAQAIDSLIEAVQTQGVSSNGFSRLWDAVAIPVLLLIAVAIGTSLLSYLQEYIVAGVGERLTLSLRKEVNAKIERLPLRFFDSNATGDILSRVTNDLEKVSEVLQTGLVQFISATLTIVVTIIAMLIINPTLTAIVLVSVGLAAAVTAFISPLSHKYFSANQQAVGEINSMVEELYTGNTVIKVSNQQQSAIQSIAACNETQYKTSRQANFFSFAIYPAIRLVNQLGFIATAAAGGVMALHGQLSIGMVQAFLQYTNQISEPVTQFPYIINALQGAFAGAERVFTLLDEEEETPDDPAIEPIHCEEGMVAFSHVSFGYTQNKTLMHDISFQVKPNEMVAIVGPTGGGKTTLINLLMRFYEINRGTITIDGHDITSMPREKLRRLIGMVLQDTWLFEGSIAENISCGKPGASMEEIISAAKAARCHSFIQTLPEGYETIVSTEATHLSQGQLQLITIARAILSDPLIMILDEATSSVDTRTEKEIQKAMYSMMKGKTSFVIAHRLSTIIDADLILVVKDGDIIETGNHLSLLKSNGFYTSLYNSQFADGPGDTA